ncbi:MAG: DUF2927 domain-containing protein [Marinosulfonomonas sp.]
MWIASCGTPAPKAVQPATGSVHSEMNTFSSRPAPATTRSNESIAQEFIPLAFDLETGTKLPVMSRFETPVTLRVAGDGLNEVGQTDLNNLLVRLRNEAGISITQVPASQHANITVHVLKLRKMQRLVPDAACFVAPRVESWAEYKANRKSDLLDWTTLKERTKLTVFIPGDVAPQEVRDCLHEEIAQALGPVNDLYQLTDSIFNDDNFRNVLTGFDMMVLRAYYDPELHSGMTRSEVAARLPAILQRINPEGRTGFSSATSTPRPWIMQIETALSGRKSATVRLNAAESAVQIARALNWNDNRLAFALYVRGKLTLTSNTKLSISSFAEAESIYRSDPNTQIHAANISLQAAAFALSAGQANDAMTIVDTNIPVVLEAQNAALLAEMLMIKAEALDYLGQSSEAETVRLDSIGWARYGIGSESEIRRRLSEISNLNPKNRRTASR